MTDADREALSAQNAQMREALELWDENFHRNLVSRNFLGDDDHEAHKLGDKALALPVLPSVEPKGE